MFLKLVSILLLFFSVSLTLASEKIYFSHTVSSAKGMCEKYQELANAMNGLGMSANLSCSVSNKAYWLAGDVTISGQIEIEHPELSCVEGIPAMFSTYDLSIDNNPFASNNFNQNKHLIFSESSISLDICDASRIPPLERFKSTTSVDEKGRLYIHDIQDNDKSYTSSKTGLNIIGVNLLGKASRARNFSQHKRKFLAEAIWMLHIARSLIRNPSISSSFDNLSTWRYSPRQYNPIGITLSGTRKATVKFVVNLKKGANSINANYLTTIEALVEKRMILPLSALDHSFNK